MEGLEEITLELCNRCPQQCLHCSSVSSPLSTDQLDRSRTLQLIHEAASLGTRRLSLGGGEPFLSEHLNEVLTEAATWGMELEVFTCGMAEVPPRLAPLPSDLLAALTKIPRLKLIFSLHGAVASTHDYLTQTEGGYSTLLTSLRRCTLLGITCEINFVPLRPNAKEFGELVSLADSLNVRRVSVLRFVPQGRGARNRDALKLCHNEEDMFVRRLLALREQSRVEIRTGSPFNGIVPGNRVPCRAGFRKLVVQPTGNVLPCEVFKHQRRCQWHLSIYERSLVDILQDASLTALRKRLQDSDCLQCPVHHTLREQQKAQGGYERIPESAIPALGRCSD